MKTETLKEIAKKHNAQIRKEIKIMQGGITEGKNKNELIKKLISTK